MNRKPLQNWPSEVQTAYGWRAIIIQIAMVTIASGAIAYVATDPQQLARTAAAVVSPVEEVASKTAPPPTPQTQPVGFTNPFDQSEVFEFPSGTSEAEARQSVAELLLERARERKDAWFRAKHPTPSH